MYTIMLGLRSLFMRKKQYTPLLLVCLVGTGISLFCIFLIKGMLFSLEAKARIYYGGDFMFIGGHSALEFADYQAKIEEIRGVFGEDARINPRFEFGSETSAAFFFEGTSAKQRVIKGVDFVQEKEIFDSFNYLQGNADNMAGSSGVLLSAPIAESLGCNAGDEVTLMLRTAQGYINTIQLEVQGIFKDSSIFGMFTSYMDFDCLKSAAGYPEKYANRLCVLFPDGAEKLDAEVYQARLEQILPMYPLSDDKQVFYNNFLGKGREEYMLVTLSANMQDLRMIIQAMRGISAFVIAMLLLIIVAGIGSTYRVIVMKRINEIGIFMAIGMKTASVIEMILSESLLLLLSGTILGLILSLLLCGIASAMDFSFIPAFDLFLVNSHLVPQFDARATLLVGASVIFLTLIAVLSAIWKSVRIMPVRALAVTE